MLIRKLAEVFCFDFVLVSAFRPYEICKNVAVVQLKDNGRLYRPDFYF